MGTKRGPVAQLVNLYKGQEERAELGASRRDGVGL